MHWKSAPVIAIWINHADQRGTIHMPSIKEIPIKYVAERAKAQLSAAEARPYRDLLSDWFKENHCEAEGFLLLKSIDDHFPPANAKPRTSDEKMLVHLPDIVLGRFRSHPESTNMLVGIIHEIHRRMTIPLEESKKAKRPEDMRKTSWTWPHVMRVMRERGIINEKTTKAQFGAMIEMILGDKVRPNSIRRTKYGDYSIVTKFKYDLSDFDEDVCHEILGLFMPLLSTKI